MCSLLLPVISGTYHPRSTQRVQNQTARPLRVRAPLLPAPSKDALSASAVSSLPCSVLTRQIMTAALICRGEAASKTPPAPRGGSRQSWRPEGGVLYHVSPGPWPNVPGFISDFALSSIQSLVYRRGIRSIRGGERIFLGHEEGSTATPVPAAPTLYHSPRGGFRSTSFDGWTTATRPLPIHPEEDLRL